MPGRKPMPGRQGKRPANPLRAAARPPALRPDPQRDGEGRPFITLAAFLKAAELAPSGGQAKARVRAGGIQVNGAEELRPGRKLHHGDAVQVDGETYDVQVAGA